MKKLLSALFLLALCSSLAAATVPDPTYCTVTPIYGGPLAADECVIIHPANHASNYYTITVHNSSDAAIPGAVVKVQFTAGILVCGTPTPIHEVIADGSGVANIYLRGGGCMTNVADACRFLANDIQIRVVKGVRSTDNGDHNLNAPDLAVNAVDLGKFGAEFKGTYTTQPLCHDYNLDTVCNAVDLSLFGAGFKGGWVCTP